MEKQAILALEIGSIVVIVLFFIFRKDIWELITDTFFLVFPGKEKDDAMEKPEAPETENMSVLNFLLGNEEGKKILNETAEGKAYLQRLAIGEAAVATSELNIKLLKAHLKELGLWSKLLSKLKKKSSKRWLKYLLAYAVVSAVFIKIGMEIFKS